MSKHLTLPFFLADAMNYSIGRIFSKKTCCFLKIYEGIKAKCPLCRWAFQTNINKITKDFLMKTFDRFYMKNSTLEYLYAMKKEGKNV